MKTRKKKQPTVHHLESKTADELISHNISTIRSLQERSQDATHREYRFVHYVTRLLARPATVYLTLAIVGFWIAVNTASIYAFDPWPFNLLQGVLSLSAFLTAIIVLATQRRQDRVAEQRAHLELQVNLLAEHKVAKLISLVEELRRDLPNVRDRVDHVAETMKQPTSANDVFSAIEDSIENK